MVNVENITLENSVTILDRENEVPEFISFHLPGAISLFHGEMLLVGKFPINIPRKVTMLYIAALPGKK